jgi:hypothetical protein
MARTKINHKSIAKRRMRGVRMEYQHTAHYYIFRTLRWLALKNPAGPWKDITYKLYSKPVVGTLIYANGKLVSRQVIRANQLTGITIVIKEKQGEPTPALP